MNANLVAMRSAVGLKVVTAVSGVILFGWVVLHLVGNLTLFGGPGAADGYAAWLRRSPALLWAVRLGVGVAAGVHVWAVATLARRARRASGIWWGQALRAGGGLRGRARVATTASRSMRVGGALLLAFVVYHLLHLTFGVVHPEFQSGAIHHNVIRGLAAPALAFVYVAAAALLGLHLSHGLWAVLGSLGLQAGRDPRRGRKLARALGATVGLLFASIPLAVVTGVLR